MPTHATLRGSRTRTAPCRFRPDASGIEPDESTSAFAVAFDSTPITRPTRFLISKQRKPRHNQKSTNINQVWQVVVPPILFHSVICLETSLLRRCVCDSCEPNHFAATGPLPCDNSPPALLPIGHSPSRRHRCRRWWAFTPPVRPLRARFARAGIFSVAVVVLGDLRHRDPDLLFRQAIAHHLATTPGVGKFLWRFYKYQRRNTCLPNFNEPPGNRTLNLQLKRLLLCRLS